MYELLKSLEVHRFFFAHAQLSYEVISCGVLWVREIKIDFQQMENPDITIGSISWVRVGL